tara:strand:+ start:94 stop:660 length:567 start_codon:yes stop_codon:yes gene_type:complete
MIVIEDKIISEDLKEKHFICDLTVCKGACCIEGDGGAPLEVEELEKVTQIFEKVKPYLTKEGIAAVEEFGAYVYDEEEKTHGTTLVNGKACAFVNYEKGITYCGIEKAYNRGEIDFMKPISCHLYPIRVTKYDTYEAVNYETWDICSAACVKGAQEKVPVYKFLKTPLIRKYGKKFFDALEFAFQDKD